MKIINIALNSMFIGLSITCLSGIAYAVVIGTCNVLGII